MPSPSDILNPTILDFGGAGPAQLASMALASLDADTTNIIAFEASGSRSIAANGTMVQSVQAVAFAHGMVSASIAGSDSACVGIVRLREHLHRRDAALYSGILASEVQGGEHLKLTVDPLCLGLRQGIDLHAGYRIATVPTSHWFMMHGISNKLPTADDKHLEIEAKALRTKERFLTELRALAEDNRERHRVAGPRPSTKTLADVVREFARSAVVGVYEQESWAIRLRCPEDGGSALFVYPEEEAWLCPTCGAYAVGPLAAERLFQHLAPALPNTRLDGDRRHAGSSTT